MARRTARSTTKKGGYAGSEAELWAHSRNDEGDPHLLLDHLSAVAKRAREHTAKFGAGELGKLLGWWHDIGKVNPKFQQFLLECDLARKEGRDPPFRGPEHSGAGGKLAKDLNLDLLCFPILGHHGGLPNRNTINERFACFSSIHDEQVKRFNTWAPKKIADTKPDPNKCFPSRVYQCRLSAEFFLRILFSALVDGDFLDTEAHLKPAKARVRREPKPDMAALFEKFKASQHELIEGADPTHLNEVRRELSDQCLEAASKPPGIYRLAVPTGGGKTRMSLGFGLQHAIAHEKDRIIVGIPYTSIIEQTVDTYRKILGEEVVLEHHSAVPVKDDSVSPDPAEQRSRLLAENWDAPVVVTTNVQLFESLFSNRTSACRKLHNLVNSVIVLDEAQTLPVELITPTLNVLQELVDYYGVTLLLCTATQPALSEREGFRGLRNVQDVLPDASKYYDDDTFRRVDFDLAFLNGTWNWDEVAEQVRKQIREHGQALCIVNTISDAEKLICELKGSKGLLHLSTRLCGAHRKRIIKKVRIRLKRKQPCLLVSTQVVEAGVDLDFPVVFRAVGPLDSIVQAAGRCNREGKLPHRGKVIVFEPEEGGSPPGWYRTATDEAKIVLKQDTDLHQPEVYENYFRSLYKDLELDKKGIQNLREKLDYPKTAKTYRLIEKDTVPVVVPYRLARKKIKNLLERLNKGVESPRKLMRLLQPYLVNIYRNKVPLLRSQGYMIEILEGLWQWEGKYDDLLGIQQLPGDPADYIH
ncbi:MAG: CRISPR-associated helicase Cas3' [Candidatus Brocadiales bacterium]|nr:CRISPR-associated helicase Cas3' [Candidatus Bathyanammoxibius sp.]